MNKNFWKGKKVLVTGGAGFIGSNLIELLVSLDAQVCAVDNLERGKLEYLSNSLDKIVFVNADLRDKNTCKKFCKSTDIVFHLAAKVGGIGYYTAKSGEVILQNMLLDSTMLEAVLEENVPRYFYASSAHVYPITLQLNPDAPLIKEEDALPANPELSYGWAKLIAEKQIEYSAKENPNFRAAVARLIGVYGKNQDINLDTGSAIPVFISRAIEFPKMQPFLIWGSGFETRSYCYIDDVIDGMLRMVEKLDGQQIVGPINLGNEKRIRIEDLAKEVIKISGKEIKIEKDESKSTIIWGQTLDCSRAKILLDGWEATTPLQTGLKKSYDNILEQYGNN